jgi:hypothetical protein
LEVAATELHLPLDVVTNRDAIREQAEPLYRAVEADPDHLSVYSTDKDGPWRIVVRYVGEAPDPSVRALAPSNAPVEWLPAKYSFSDLTRVDNEIAVGGLLGTRIGSVYIDTTTNSVVVALPTDDQELQQQLTEAYGDILTFVIEPMPAPILCLSTSDPAGQSRFNCTPWRGSIAAEKIQGYDVLGNGNSPCTWTAWAKQGTTARYLATAGHCNSPIGSHQSYWHNAVFVGESLANTLCANHGTQSSDWLLVAANGNSTQSNRFYDTANNRSAQYTAVKAVSTIQIGDYSYKSGLGWRTWGTHFGHITGLNVGYTLNGCAAYGEKADTDVSGGDSGAIMEYAAKLLGTGSAGAGTPTDTNGDGYVDTWPSVYISPAEFLQNTTSFRFCLTPDCS